MNIDWYVTNKQAKLFIGNAATRIYLWKDKNPTAAVKPLESDSDNESSNGGGDSDGSPGNGPGPDEGAEVICVADSDDDRKKSAVGSENGSD